MDDKLGQQSEPVKHDDELSTEYQPITRASTDHPAPERNHGSSDCTETVHHKPDARMSCEYDIITNSLELEGIICDIEMTAMDCPKEAWSPRVRRDILPVIRDMWSPDITQWSPVVKEEENPGEHDGLVELLNNDGLCGPCR